MARGSGRASYREGVGFGALTFIALAVLGFGSSIAIARVYGVEVMGHAALVLAPAYALNILSSLREQAALVRKLSVLEPRHPRITGLFTAVLTWSTAFTSVVCVATAFATYYVFKGPIGTPELFMPALVNLIANVLVGNVGWSMDTLLAAFRAGRQLFWVRFAEALTFLAVAVAAGIALGTVWGIVWATIASQAVALAIRVWWLPNIMRFAVPLREIRDGFRELPEMLLFGVRIAPGFVAEGLSSQAGTWILGITHPVAAVGAWGRAYQLYQRLGQGTNRMTEMLLPTLVERRDRGDTEGYDRSLVDSIRYTAVALLMAGAAGGGAAEGVMSLFGPGFDQAATGLSFLLTVPAIASVSKLLNTCLLAENMPGRTSVVAVGHSLAAIVLAIILIPIFGITGAAMAVALGWLVSVAWLVTIARKVLSTSFRTFWPVREMGAMAAAYVSGFLVARLLDSTLPGVPGLLAALAAGTLAYVGVFLASGGLNDRDRDRLSGVRAKRRRRRASRAGAAAPGDEVLTERMPVLEPGPVDTVQPPPAVPVLTAASAGEPDRPPHAPSAPSEERRPARQVRGPALAFAGGAPGGSPGAGMPRPMILAGVIGALGLALAAAAMGTFTEQHFLILAGVTAGVALVYIAWNSDPAWSLSIGLALTVFSSHWDRLGFPLGLDRLLIGTALLAVILRAPPMRDRGPLRFGWVEWALAACILYAFASAVLVGTLLEPRPFFELIDRLGVVPLLVLIAAPIVYRNHYQRMILLGTFVALGAYLGVLAGLETLNLNALIFPSYITDPLVGEHIDRARGPFAQSVGNGLALYTCAVASAVAWRMWERPVLRAAAGAVTLLCLAGIVFTLTRSIWLSAAVATVLVAVAAKELRRYVIPIVAGGAVVVTVLLVVVPGLSDSAAGRAASERQVWDRLNLNRAAVNMVEERPLTGFGWGAFTTASRDHFRQADDYPITAVGIPAHNTFLGNAAELGLVGTLLWVAALGGLAATALLGRAPPEIRLFRLGFAAILIQFLIVANFVPLTYPFTNTIIWAWGGLVAGHLVRERARRRREA